MIITAEMSRAARALLRWDQQELANAAALSLRTVKRAENTKGPLDATDRTLRAIADAFAGAGVSFENDGRVTGAWIKAEEKPT